MNLKEIDDSKGICIGPDGKLLVDGIRPMRGKIDANGYEVFKVRSNSNPSTLENRYVHVEVFRHFSSLPALPPLGPQDVEFIEGRTPHIHNLRLSDEATERIFGGKKKKEPKEPEKSEEPKSQLKKDNELPAAEKEEEPAKEPSVKEKDDEPSEGDKTRPPVYKATKGPGGYFDIIDPDTGESVVDALNGGKKPRGEEQLQKVAEREGVTINV